MNPIALAVPAPAWCTSPITSAYVIRKIDASKTITTVAGNNKYRSVPDGTPAINSFFDSPQGVAVDNSGNLYIAEFRFQPDTPGNFVRSIQHHRRDRDTGMLRRRHTGNRGFVECALFGGAGFQNNIYFADSGNHRIRQITINGTTDDHQDVRRGGEILGSRWRI